MPRYQSLTRRLIPDRITNRIRILRRHTDSYELTSSHATRLLGEYLLVVVDELEEIIKGVDETLDCRVGLCLGLLTVNPETGCRNRK